MVLIRRRYVNNNQNIRIAQTIYIFYILTTDFADYFIFSYFCEIEFLTIHRFISRINYLWRPSILKPIFIQLFILKFHPIKSTCIMYFPITFILFFTGIYRNMLFSLHIFHPSFINDMNWSLLFILDYYFTNISLFYGEYLTFGINSFSMSFSNSKMYFCTCSNFDTL